MYSPAGNRAPVSRVTGGDTHHYTTEDISVLARNLFVFSSKQNQLLYYDRRLTQERVFITSDLDKLVTASQYLRKNCYHHDLCL